MMASIRLRVVDALKTSPGRLELITSQCGDKKSQVASKKVILEGVWTQNHIPPQSIIHLLNPLHDIQEDTYIIDNNQGLLVIEPDSLLTCTYVASSLFCERKTWLNHLFLGQVGTNRAMLVGTLVHEVFQHGVRHKIVDTDVLIKFLDNLLDDATIMLEIYSVELHIDDVRREAIQYIGSIKEWIEKYMLAGPYYPLTNDSNLEVKVVKVCDIEENVWSTKYGFKGKIDVTGLVKVHNRSTKKTDERVIPLELKTGNPNLSSSHAAQVSLYSMMIEDRYAETNQGLVIYLKDKAAMHNVQLKHNIKRDLVQRRNQINYHMKNYLVGPDMIDQTRVCKNCERLTECILMSNIYHPGKLAEYHSMGALEAEAIGHLDGKFFTFFQQYHERLMRLTAFGQNQRQSRAFWTYDSREAESLGLGFGKLQAFTSTDDNGTMVTFKRHPDFPMTDFETGKIVDGCKDLKQENKRQKIEHYFKPVNNKLTTKTELKPFDTNLNFSRCRIAISLDEDKQNMDKQNSSTAIAIGFMNELKETQFTLKLYEGTLDLLKNPKAAFRVDKIEKRAQHDIERVVLIRLLERDSLRVEKIRQLILESQNEPQKNAKFHLFVLTENFEQIAELDESHQRFIVEAASTDNYYILDEKVEPNKQRVDRVISTLARVVVQLERSILIVAPNVDQLLDLMKSLQQKKAKFILIDDGKSTKARYQFAANLVKVAQLETIDLKAKFNAYIRRHEESPIVITSYAMSVGGLLFTRRNFDYCVCYECDTTELLLSLSPMFCSDRYVIVDVQGDSQQETLAPASNDLSKSTSGDGEPCKQDKPLDGTVTLGNHLRLMRKEKSKPNANDSIWGKVE